MSDAPGTKFVEEMYICSSRIPLELHYSAFRARKWAQGQDLAAVFDQLGHMVETSGSSGSGGGGGTPMVVGALVVEKLKRMRDMLQERRRVEVCEMREDTNYLQQVKARTRSAIGAAHGTSRHATDVMAAEYLSRNEQGVALEGFTAAATGRADTHLYVDVEAVHRVTQICTEAVGAITSDTWQAVLEEALWWCTVHASRLRKAHSPLLLALRIEKFLGTVMQSTEDAGLAHTHSVHTTASAEALAYLQTQVSPLVLGTDVDGSETPRFSLGGGGGGGDALGEDQGDVGGAALPPQPCSSLHDNLWAILQMLSRRSGESSGTLPQPPEIQAERNRDRDQAQMAPPASEAARGLRDGSLHLSGQPYIPVLRASTTNMVSVAATGVLEEGDGGSPMDVEELHDPHAASVRQLLDAIASRLSEAGGMHVAPRVHPEHDLTRMETRAALEEYVLQQGLPPPTHSREHAGPSAAGGGGVGREGGSAGSRAGPEQHRSRRTHRHVGSSGPHRQTCAPTPPPTSTSLGEGEAYMLLLGVSLEDMETARADARRTLAGQIDLITGQAQPGTFLESLLGLAPTPDIDASGQRAGADAAVQSTDGNNNWDKLEAGYPMRRRNRNSVSQSELQTLLGELSALLISDPAATYSSGRMAAGSAASTPLTTAHIFSSDPIIVELRRRALVRLMRAEALRAHAFPSVPALVRTVQLGVTATQNSRCSSTWGSVSPAIQHEAEQFNPNPNPAAQQQQQQQQQYSSVEDFRRQISSYPHHPGGGGDSTAMDTEPVHSTLDLSTTDGLLTPPEQSCPVCSHEGRHIAGRLPRFHRTRTTLRCRGSGQLMGQDNPPMCLPNGQVYSRSFIYANLTVRPPAGEAASDEAEDTRIATAAVPTPVPAHTTPSSAHSSYYSPLRAARRQRVVRVSMFTGGAIHDSTTTTTAAAAAAVMRTPPPMVGQKRDRMPDAGSGATAKAPSTGSGFTCPHTGAHFPLTAIRNVYIV